MGAPDFSLVQEPKEICAILAPSSNIKPSEPPVEDICKFLEKVQLAPTLDHVTLQRIFRALQSWLKSCSCHKMLEGGIVPALAKVCDSLLLADYSKSDVVTSLLDLLFLVEDISEVPGGKDICGKHFIPRILDLALTKLASVNLRRAAVETLCALITKCPGNQCALLDRMPDCLKLFNFLLPKCGDFQLQASTAETLYRLSRREPQLLNCLKDEVLRGTLRSLNNMKKPNLLTEIRDFVVLLNESLGPFRSVYSFLGEWIVVNGRNVAAEEKWVDFGTTLFSFCSSFEPSSTPAKQTDDCGALIIDILYLDIIDIRKSSAKQLEIIAHYQNSSSTSIQDKPSGCRKMHIRISFAPEDLLMIMKHVVPKIHLRQGGQDDETAGGSSCRSSQGILIPLRIKGDEETSNILKREHNNVDNVEAMTVSAKAARPTPHTNENAPEVRSAAYDSHVKSPCSHLIEETLADVRRKQPLSPVRCERARLAEIGAFKARSTKEFKKPADRPSSGSGLERQPETERHKITAIADKDVVPKEPESRGVPAQQDLLQKLKLPRSATQSILATACGDQNRYELQKSLAALSAPLKLSEAQLKAAGGEENVNEGDPVAITESKAGASIDDSVPKRNVGGAHTPATGKPMGQHLKHPAAGLVVAKKMSDNSLKAEAESRLVSKDSRAVSDAKRRHSGGGDLPEVSGMLEGPAAQVEFRLHSKRVRLQVENGIQDSVDLIPQMPNREPRGGDNEDRGAAVSNTRVYITRTGMKQPAVSDSAKSGHQQAELRRKRQVDPLADTGNTPDSEPETQGRTSKRLKRPATTDPIETDSDKLEKPLKRVTVIKTTPERRGANRQEEQVRKPRGRPPKEKALAPSEQNERGTNFENVYSFSQTEGLQTTRSRGRKALRKKEVHRKCSPEVQVGNSVYSLLGSPRERDSRQENFLFEDERARSSNGEPKAIQALETDVDNVYSLSQKEDVRGFLRGRNAEEDIERPVKYSSAVKEGAADAPKEREGKQKTVSWREKAIISTTKRREPLRDLQPDIGNVLSKAEDVCGLKLHDQAHREDKQSPPEYSPAILKRKGVPPLLKSYDKKKENNVRIRSWGQVEDSLSPVEYIPAVRKGKAAPARYQKLHIRSPNARVSIDRHVEGPKEKEKVLTSRTKFKKNSKALKDTINKMLGCEKPKKKRELKSGSPVTEEEEELHINYSSPVPAVRPEVKAARKRPQLSSSPKSDEASDDEVFPGEDRGRGPKLDVLLNSANEDREVAADTDSSVRVSDKEKCLSGRPLQSAQQRRWKSSRGPRVKFTGVDDSDEDVATVGVNKQGRVRSSKRLSHRMKKRKLTVVKDDEEDEEEDEDDDEGEEGVGRAVKMVAETLEKFKSKVKVQTEKKTIQVLTAALENVEREADALHAKLYQNFDGFLKICKRKFENLEVQLQDQNKRATIWQEKVVDDFEEHRREYDSLSTALKETETELQGLAEKDRVTQQNMFSQLQVSTELHLANADKKILAIKKSILFISQHFGGGELHLSTLCAINSNKVYGSFDDLLSSHKKVIYFTKFRLAHNAQAAKRMLGLRDVLKSFQLGEGD